MKADDIKQYFEQMDKEWAESAHDNPLSKSYTESKSGALLNHFCKHVTYVPEFFVTDLHGGLVASSQKTTDFYQADEYWWQKAFSNGKGSIYIGDVDYDESSKSWGLSVCLPIKDEAGSLIGIAKAIVDAEHFFSDIANVTIGKTGRSSIVNNAGYYIYGDRTRPLSKSICSKKDFSDLLAFKKNWIKVKQDTGEPETYMFVSAYVNSPALYGHGIEWHVVFSRAYNEICEPLYKQVFSSTSLLLIFILIILIIVYIYATLLTLPISALGRSIDMVQKGNYEQHVKVTTYDEIEDLAISFNSMIDAVKNGHRLLQNSSDELEARVIERTSEVNQSKVALVDKIKEINDSRIAILNIMKDLDEERTSIEKAYNELKITQSKLVRVERLAAIGELAGSVSHELRNPLAVIKNTVYLLRMQDTLKSDVKLQEYIGMLDKESNVMDKIIGDILEFSRIKVSKFSMININIAIASTISSLNLPEGIIVTKDLEKDMPNVNADLLQIQRVLSNLIANAVDAMERKGTLTVRTYSEGGFVKISVEDTGCGVTPENMDKLFDPLFTTKAKGIGLGLSICHSIIEAHNGIIDVESHAGIGTKFTIKLPA